MGLPLITFGNMTPEEQKIIDIARNSAQVILSKAELAAVELVEKAKESAAQLIEDANKTSSQLVLNTRIDVSKIVREEIGKAIQDKVNGKIDKMQEDLYFHNKIHEQDMADMKPFMQAAGGVGLIWKGLVAVGALAVIWMQLKASLFGH